MLCVLKITPQHDSNTQEKSIDVIAYLPLTQTHVPPWRNQMLKPAKQDLLRRNALKLRWVNVYGLLSNYHIPQVLTALLATLTCIIPKYAIL